MLPAALFPICAFQCALPAVSVHFYRSVAAGLLTPPLPPLPRSFHGIQPSKNKQDKRLRKRAEEVALQKAATSEAVAERNRLAEVQKQEGSAYVVLSGKAQQGPGAGARPGGMPSSKGNAAPTPVAGARTPMLGGGLTPLAGNSKVEAMLGVKKPGGGGSMLPPAPRQPKQ